MSALEETRIMPATALIPTHKTRLKVGLFSAVLSPIAFVLVLFSVSVVVDYAGVGQPLASSSGTAAIIAGTGLFSLIGTTVPKSSIGLGVTTVWAGIFTVFTQIFPQASNEYARVVDQLILFPTKSAAVTTALASLSWCGFVSLTFAISLSAFLAARISRRIRLHELDQERPVPKWLRVLYGNGKPFKEHSLYGDAQWFENPGTSLSPSRARYHLVILTIDILLSVALWAFFITIAPKDTSQMAVYGPLALGLNDPAPGGIAVIAGTLFLITATAGWSMLGPLITATLLMIFPGMIAIPVWATLTGNVAMPGDPVTTSFALASPVIGTLGVIILALTWGIHWVRVAPIENNLQD